jgi:uncharacterized cupin superfamily protein
VSVPEHVRVVLEFAPEGPLSVISGAPRAARRRLYRDDLVECGVWEVTPGEFLAENLEFSEHVHVLSGEATVTSEGGTSVELRPGVSFMTQAGWRGAWSVRKTVRKIYIVWKTPWWPADPHVLV